MRISRRSLLKRAGSIGAGVLLGARAAQARVDTLRVAGKAVEILIAPATPQTVRISIVAIDDGRPQSIPLDGSLVEREWPPATRVSTLAEPQTVRAGELELKVSNDPLEIAVTAKDGRAVQRLTVDPATGALQFSLGPGPVLGLGEGGAQFDRRGAVHRMRSGQGGYRLRTHGGCVPIPWLVGTSGWAMFLHHPHGTFDLTGSRGRFDPGGQEAALPIDLFVVGAREPGAILAEYARLTGYPEMPPLWSFGYFQSHRTLASREEILAEAAAFREKKLPCDAFVFLGTGFCPSGWNTDNGEFAFNEKVFAEPKAMIERLHDDHLKVVLHVVLEGRRLTGTVYDSCTAPPLPSGRTPDGRWPDERQASCYWPFHKPLFDAGADGWWPDQGDGLDAPSRLARIRMYWDGSRAWRPGDRPFALHRNGHAGMQRYAPFLWSGDVYSTWETLKTHVPIAINTGLSGIPLWGTDIGGFVPTRELTGELYVRWFQFGAFCPLFRAHGRTWKLRLPWGWNAGDIGPDEIASYTGGAANPDASELHNAAVEPICRRYLELRYRLLPYLYSVARESAVTGLPIVRALWLHHPEDATAVERGDEYLWGRDILVAPVVERGATSRELYLPHGVWHDFWSEERHEGGRELSRAVDLATLPLFVRAGAIVPLGPVKQHTGERSDAPLVLQVYPGADGAFTLYEDDGATFRHRDGDWMGVEARWEDSARRLSLRLAAGSRMRPPASRPVHVRVAGTRLEGDVVFSGAPVEISL